MEGAVLPASEVRGSTMNAQAPRIEIVVEDGTSADDRAAITQALDNLGIAAALATADPEDLQHSIASGRSRFDPGVEGAYTGANHWSMSIHGRINEIATGYGPASLRDAVDDLRRLRARQTGSSPADGTIMLVDEDTGIRVDLKFQLPLAAYEDLQALRFSTFEADPISFHQKSGRNGRWRPPH
jgi:hypothetical protein